MIIVTDTNIIISALIRVGFTRELILDKRFQLIIPAHSLSEIEKNKEEICKRAEINLKDFYDLLNVILRNIQIINPFLYKEYIEEAEKIIGHIHLNDAPFIATALAFNSPIWSDDKHFKQQDKIKIYTTSDIIKL